MVTLFGLDGFSTALSCGTVAIYLVLDWYFLMLDPSVDGGFELILIASKYLKV